MSVVIKQPLANFISFYINLLDNINRKQVAVTVVLFTQ